MREPSAGRNKMSREYIARDPRTGKAIQKFNQTYQDEDIRALLPQSGPWQRIPLQDILLLASGKVKKIELPINDGRGGFAGRIDGIKALNRVLGSDVDKAHSILLDALDDDYPDDMLKSVHALDAYAAC